IEFVASFPRRPGMAWPWRVALIGWAIGVAIRFLTDDPRDRMLAVEWWFFAPATMLVFALCAIAWRRSRDRDPRPGIAMLGFRWAFGFGAYFLGPRLGVFDQAVWAETTVASSISFVVIGTAVLRTELFSIRSAAAEVLTIAAIALVVALAGGLAVIATL